MIILKLYKYFRGRDKYERQALYREPGELQTGQGEFRKMVLEEPLLSDPARLGVKEWRDPALMDGRL